ncbi:hypothetical protein AB0C10_02500 [Microbispora amethystogenes]|uniref:hypothetical protein n=1 Tax=Microbispora amethystogenes TaxID=1427754 RepID=UPI0033D979A8
MGVRADVTYLPLGKRCAFGRAPAVAGDHLSLPKEDLASRDPAVQARNLRKAQRLASERAVRPEHGITIYPRFIGPGQIVLIEINENPVPPDTTHPGVAWQFSGRLTDGPVTPCRVVDDPGAFDMGTAGPPPGS